jgi:hypothetical protein
VRTTLLIAVAFLTTTALAIASSQPITQPAVTAPTATPAIVAALSYTQGMPGPHSTTSSGPVLVLWDDGLVVFATISTAAGKDMQSGRLAPAQVQRVRDELTEAGAFKSLPGGGTAPDAAYWTLKAASGGKAASYRCWWDANRAAPVGLTAEATDEHLSYARMWTRARLAIALAYPINYQSLDKDADAKQRYERALHKHEFPN